MSEARRTDRSGANVEWALRLECGHEISVPWGDASPAVMGCIVQHRAKCEDARPDLSGMGWWAAPLLRAPVPTFR
jgi:hypothetical protein